MAYHHLLLSPPHPHPARLSLVTSRRRPRAGRVAAACSPSPSALAAGRRAVLLVGVSVLPLLRLRDAAFAAAAARPPSTTTVDLVTGELLLTHNGRLIPVLEFCYFGYLFLVSSCMM
jgi:hypothetical protein